MLNTLTYAVRLHTTMQETQLLTDTCTAFLSCCNTVSDTAYQQRTISQKKLNKLTYHKLREEYHVGAQMAQSAIIRVIGNYRTIAELHGSSWHGKHPHYHTMGYDLVYNRDYSVLKDGRISINTLQGRVKFTVDWSHMPQPYRHGKFGTARILQRNNKWLLLIPSTITISEPKQPQQIVGIDMGLRFLATAYDSDGHTTFFSGKEVSNKRAHYKTLRAQLQKKGTRSARRKLQAIGKRENRWMRDINHQVSQALISQQAEPTLFVLENLTGIRQATQKVRKRDRYVQVSWAYYQLRTMIEYKAKQHGHTCIAIDPKYTSQTCPRCGMVCKTNRNKRMHEYRCANCSYQSNDDRVAAMNIQRIGYMQLVESQSDKL
ncbi:transposase [Galliscardovia ingluviei]|uniref:Transposase n=1 Tax=Galliscardovia ingluviei TaxID=1769422 RepID=A0A8J3AMF4_9BIFI|nr:RNA-guided endonuclease TnpB family protein [Galliscardovia ingluviei]GGI15450.1 transposase [Galliscardovia ingluviei]